MDQLIKLMIDESKWLPAAMGIAFLAVVVLVWRQRKAEISGRRRVLAVMNLFLAVTLLTMAFGHVLAVTTKLALGTLNGSIPVLYGIGAALGIPSWFVIRHSRQVLVSDDYGRATVAVNAWLATTLLALGLHNAPLAAPALLNVGYHLHSHRMVGWTIVGATVALHVALFIGALTFMATGQSFEQFSGM